MTEPRPDHAWYCSCGWRNTIREVLCQHCRREITRPCSVPPGAVSRLWLLLFGPLYLARKRWYRSAFIWVIVVGSTLGLAWPFTALFAQEYVERTQDW